MSRRKKLKVEHERLMQALAKAQPGTPLYKELIEQLEALEHVGAARKESSKLIPGVKNDTLAIGAFTMLQIGLLAKLQDEKFLPKNLFSFFTKFKNQ